MSELLDQIQQARLSVRPRPFFTLEPGRGETYAHRKPVLYAHGTYERGSVLAGQPRRLWVAEWSTWEEARAALAEVRKVDRTFKFEDFGDGGGSTHVPTSVLTRNLPDEDW